MKSVKITPTSNTGKELVNALVPVTPTEIVSPLLVDLVQRYKHFARASAENIVELAKTLATAKSALSPEEHKTFCEDVGLNPKSSTYRKLTVIGDKAARFEPHLARMPAAWTTVYKLAKLSDEKFDDVAKNDRFSPFMTAKSITAIVEPKAIGSKRASETAANEPDVAPKSSSDDEDEATHDVQAMSTSAILITLDMSELDAAVARDLYFQILEIQKDECFKIKLSDGYQALLDRTLNAVPANDVFQMELAA